MYIATPGAQSYKNCVMMLPMTTYAGLAPSAAVRTTSALLIAHLIPCSCLLVEAPIQLFTLFHG